MDKATAINYFGGPTRLGRILHLTRQAIHAWPDEVPDLYQFKLHHLSGGKLEIDPEVLQRAQAPMRAESGAA